MRDFANVKKLIIKIGSSSLVGNDMTIKYDVIDSIMKSIKKLNDNGIKTTLVTSGAIAVGMIELNLSTKPHEMALKQVCAAVGQAKLMEVYNQYSKRYGLLTGQILVNHDDFQVRKRMLNLTESLDAMLKNNVIPIINENDALAVEEIKVGDNDTLSALIAPMVSADLLILFSDIEGLYNKNPKDNMDAVMLSTVEEINEEVFQMAGKEGSKFGTGGMATKINAALIATSAGCNMIICNSNRLSSLEDIVQGDDIGTLFLKQKNAISSREHWMIYKTTSSGEIIIDEGLNNILHNKKTSILPKGVISVNKDFLEGAIIDVKNTNGEVVAKGIANFSSDEIKKIIGLSSDEIKNVLGNTKKNTIIHANNLVFIKEEKHGTIIK